MNFLKNFTEPVDLSEHMLATYQILRVLLVAVALAFPWVLWVGGLISRDNIGLQGSMSAYYHANRASTTEFVARADAGGCKPLGTRDCVQLDSGRGVMRDWFVGVLFAVSALLIVYKGYRPAENVALNLAGTFAVLVALVPTAWDEPSLPYHGIFAFAFFACIAYVCIFCASATLPLVKEEKRARYRRIYKLLGYVMIASPIGASILSYAWGLGAFLFFAEAFGVYSFASYWLVKTLEIRETNADRRAVSGELLSPAGKGPADVFRQMPVIQAKAQNVEAKKLDQVKQP